MLHQSPDSLNANSIVLPDTNLLTPDSLLMDTISPGTSENALDSKVQYKSQDSILFDIPNQKVYLYGQAEIKYENILLLADYIEIDLEKNELFAAGLVDTSGEVTGLPVFTEGDQNFEAETMRYNFRSKKGIIEGVTTEDGQGYLRGTRVKKLDNNEFNIKGGYYTTCDNPDHPHFGFHYRKSRVVPGKRIVTGPAYLVIEELPTPLAIPFGWFPVERGRRNGIIIPTYGESANRGFYFENGGYYFAIGEHVDVSLLGDIYTRGSWAVKPTLRYRKRYKYTGGFNFSYSINLLGVPETPDFSRNKDFSVRWSHRQDNAARPKSQFSADVNIKSSTFNRFNPTSAQDYLSNTFRSSVAYQTRFGKNFHLTLNAGHEQNTISHDVNVTLPEVSFNMNRMFPFRKTGRTGGKKWYDNVSVGYTMNAVNKLSNLDSLFLSKETLDMASNGIRHSIPISSPVQLLKFITWTNSVNITDRMYFESYSKSYVNDTLFQGTDTIVGYVQKDTVPGFNNIFDFNVSSSLNTRIYGMVNFGPKFPVRALRHVFTPTLSFSYRPDFGQSNWGYYDSYLDAEGQEVQYSRFEGAIYGSPSNGKSGSVSLVLSNNLEMKVRSRKDTITGMKKVMLIENFSIATSYDLAKDSLNLAPIVLSARTTLFKKLTIQFRGVWDPYILDSSGTNNLNRFEWTENRRLLRNDNTSWNLSLNWRLSSTDFNKDKEFESEAGSEAELEEINMMPEEYIDWNVPWDLNINYNFNYVIKNKYPEYIKVTEKRLVQTLGISGNLSITPKWKIGFTSGWDFESNDLSYTSISIYRDLHCWEMRFNWIPTGFRQSWNFSINAKASILQDLKLSKKKDFRDF